MVWMSYRKCYTHLLTMTYKEQILPCAQLHFFMKSGQKNQLQNHKEGVLWPKKIFICSVLLLRLGLSYYAWSLHWNIETLNYGKYMQNPRGCLQYSTKHSSTGCQGREEEESVFPKTIPEIHAMQFNWMSYSLSACHLPDLSVLNFRSFEVLTTTGHFKKFRGQKSCLPEFAGVQVSRWHIWCLVAALMEPQRKSIKNRYLISWNFIWCRVENRIALAQGRIMMTQGNIY